MNFEYDRLYFAFDFPTFFHCIHYAYVILLIIVTTARIPQISPPLDQISEYFLLLPFLIFFIGFFQIHADPTCLLFRFTNISANICLLMIIFNDVSSQIAYDLTNAFVAMNNLLIDDENLWGSFLLLVQKENLVVLCLPNANEAYPVPRDVIDVAVDLWIPVATIQTMTDCPAWILATTSHKAPLPG